MTVTPVPTPLRRRAATVSLLAAALAVTLLAQAVPAGAAQAPVELGVAGSFAVLAGSTVTNTGPTTVSGDVGVSPDLTTPGLTAAMVSNGTIHRGDAVAASAQADLTTAYVSAAGRTPAAAVPTELGGRTLTGGVYTGPTLAVTGTVTLDAQGVSSTVFVFQTEALLAATNSRVVLTNGADACNVFWQVGSSATLGTDADFVGSLLALTSITANTGASVRGRLLARNGAVTLDSNDITAPDCAADPSAPSSPPASQSASPSAPGAGTTGPSASVTGDAAPPTVDGLSPSTGPDTGGTEVVVDGTGFVPGATTETIGTTTIPAADVEVTSPTRLTFVTPARSTSTATVVVTTPAGSTPRTGLTFTYVTTAPSTTVSDGRTTTTTLATTGTQDVNLLAGAAGLLVLGLLTLALSRAPVRGRHSH